MSNKSIKKIFSPETINHLKTNKDLITSELLDTLRTSNDGKDIAFEILDIEQNEEGYYLDSFGKEISYQKIPTLKNINRKLPLTQIHKDEIYKCSQDIYYFMRNYVKIKTPKGVTYPDLRYYQLEFLDCIIQDENESVVGLLPRQSGKSVTVGIYLCWLALFEKDINIGIAAQLHSMASEFLTKVKDIFMELPIWLTPGVKVWNVKSISLENGVRLMSDTASSNAFRGHTISYSVTDEAAYIVGNDNGTTKFKAYLDSMLPSQSSLAKKKNIFISTANGMNDFYTMYKGATKNGTKNVEEILKADTVLYSDTIENHFNNTEIYNSSEIIDIKKINDNEYSVKYKQRKIGSNGSIAFNTDWRKVPRWEQDGSPKSPEKFRDEVIASKGEVFFNQAYGNKFVGSSYTLIDAELLKTLEPKKPVDVVDGKLKIYYPYEPGHQYICSVDPAKDGIDGFVVNFIDITGLQFKQVATANLDIDYLLMPAYLDDWCNMYGRPYLIIENNEGAGQSVTDQMVNTYEYDNIHYDINKNTKNVVKARKKYSGTRTTKQSRNQILKTMKTFFDNGHLEINDDDTIQQLFRFILIDGKYQADVGAHDDCVMSLALAFTLFNEVKNFSDMKTITNSIKSDLKEKDPVNIAELITIGGFDDGTDVIEHSSEVTFEGFDDEFSDFRIFDMDYDVSEFG